MHIAKTMAIIPHKIDTKKASSIPINKRTTPKTIADLSDIKPLGIGLSERSTLSILKSKTSFNTTPPAYKKIEANTRKKIFLKGAYMAIVSTSLKPKKLATATPVRISAAAVGRLAGLVSLT